MNWNGIHHCGIKPEDRIYTWQWIVFVSKYLCLNMSAWTWFPLSICEVRAEMLWIYTVIQISYCFPVFSDIGHCFGSVNCKKHAFSFRCRQGSLRFPYISVHSWAGRTECTGVEYEVNIGMQYGWVNVSLMTEIIKLSRLFFSHWCTDNA